MIESPTHYSDSSEWEHIINIDNNSLNSFDESVDYFDESADYFDESIVCFDESIDRNIDFPNNNTSTNFSNIFDSEIIAQPYEMDTDIITQKISDSSWEKYTYEYLPLYLSNNNNSKQDVLFITNTNFMVLHTLLLHSLRKNIVPNIPNSYLVEVNEYCITLYQNIPLFSIQFYRLDDDYKTIFVELIDEALTENNLSLTKDYVKNCLMTSYNEFSINTINNNDQIHVLSTMIML